MERYGLLINGQWKQTGKTIPVLDKFTGETVAQVAQATGEDVDEAVEAACAAFRRGPLPPYRRYEILSQAARLLAKRREHLIDLMIQETGFTRADAETDMNRTVQTVQTSAEEAKRIHGEMVPFDGAPGGERRLGFTLRVPVGPVCALTPFNSPLNTVAHKIAPALAAGNTVVLKPASYTPLSAIALCDILTEAGLLPGYLNLVCGSGHEIGERLLRDPRFRFYTFTGSTEVGRHIQATIGLRRSQLELGNISATIVHQDAQVERVVDRVSGAAFRKAGQVCTSVQRLLVHRDLLEPLTTRLTERVRSLRVGDPRRSDTQVGPMIDEREAQRAAEWIEAALYAGARSTTEVIREGPVLHPVVLVDTQPDMRVVAEEIFAPVVAVMPFDTLDEAIEIVNSTPYGLTAGIFTYDYRAALHAARHLEVGVVQVNDSSSSRTDLMPYGGMKASGFGREGPKYAIREMTEERLVVFHPD